MKKPSNYPPDVDLVMIGVEEGPSSQDVDEDAIYEAQRDLL